MCLYSVVVDKQHHNTKKLTHKKSYMLLMYFNETKA